jgi:hypothetical protein
MRLTQSQSELLSAIKRGVKIITPQVNRIEEAKSYRADTSEDCTEDIKALFRLHLIYWILGAGDKNGYYAYPEEGGGCEL